MERNSNDEIIDDEMMEEMAEDVGRSRKEGEPENARGTILDLRDKGLPIVLGGLVVIAIIVILFLIFGGGNKPSMADLKAVRDRLDQNESRLSRIEGREKDAASLEVRLRGLEQSLSRLDRTESTLKNGLENLGQRLDKVEKKAASRPEKKEVPARGTRQFHMVRKGDTLYRIAKKYGLSIEDLRRINHFKKNQEIFPGQKILVTP